MESREWLIWVVLVAAAFSEYAIEAVARFIEYIR